MLLPITSQKDAYKYSVLGPSFCWLNQVACRIQRLAFHKPE